MPSEHPSFTSLKDVQDRIYVVVSESYYGLIRRQRVEVAKLVFRNKDQFEYPITSETIDMFLEEALIYGASIYPSQPDTPCYAMDAPVQYENGECPVVEIYFRQMLIYKKPIPSTIQ